MEEICKHHLGCIIPESENSILRLQGVLNSNGQQLSKLISGRMVFQKFLSLTIAEERKIWMPDFRTTHNYIQLFGHFLGKGISRSISAEMCKFFTPKALQKHQAVLFVGKDKPSNKWETLWKPSFSLNEPFGKCVVTMQTALLDAFGMSKLMPKAIRTPERKPAKKQQDKTLKEKIAKKIYPTLGDGILSSIR